MKIVITGGNRGIGLELARIYASGTNEVAVICRQASEELKSLNVKIIDQVDVSQPELIDQLIHRIEFESMDLLINNAGILISSSLNHLDFGGVVDQFMVNALGPLRVTNALLPKLKSGSKIAMITSRMGSIQDNTSGGSYGYRMSKSALNAASKSLAQDLKPQGIAIALLHPGWVQTEMTGRSGHLSPVESATLLAKRIEECSLDNSGTFYHANGEVLPW